MIEVLMIAVGFIVGASARSKGLHEKAWEEFLKRRIQNTNALGTRAPTPESMVWIDRWYEQDALPPGYQVGIDPDGQEVIVRPGFVIPDKFSYPTQILCPELKWIDTQKAAPSWFMDILNRDTRYTLRRYPHTMRGRKIASSVQHTASPAPLPFKVYASSNPTHTHPLRSVPGRSALTLHSIRSYSMIESGNDLLQSAGMIPMTITDHRSTGDTYAVTIGNTERSDEESSIKKFQEKLFAFLDHGFILAHSQSVPNHWLILHPIPPTAYPWGAYPYDGISPAGISRAYIRNSDQEEIWKQQDERAKVLFRRQYGDVFDIAAHQRGEQ